MEKSYNIIEAKIKITEGKMGGNRAIGHHWGQWIESGWAKVKSSGDECLWKKIRLSILKLNIEHNSRHCTKEIYDKIEFVLN